MVNTWLQSIRRYLHRNDTFYGLSVSQLGFVPVNEGLYKLALRHRSASEVSQSGTVLNYERLEFLGDAVLGAVMAELLYKFFPNKDEGFLTRLRSTIVSRESLNDLAIHIGLNKSVVARSDISRNKHIYGDVFEAFMGAMFLDQGYANSKRFMEKFILPTFFDMKDLATVDRNYKSRLIEWGQQSHQDLAFDVTENFHSRRNRFKCVIRFGDEVKGTGMGASKKEAEQNAARLVVDAMDGGE